MKYMYCKYCGRQITDDSIFCNNCGRRLINTTDTNPITIQVDDTIQVQFKKKQEKVWISTDDFQWKRPIMARITQTFILVISLFFFCYGFYWILMRENTIEDLSICYPEIEYITVGAYDRPWGIIEGGFRSLEYDPHYSQYSTAWEKTLREIVHKNETVYKKKLDSLISTCNFIDNEYIKKYGTDDYFIIRQLIKTQPYKYEVYWEYLKYYDIAEQTAIQEFLFKTVFFLVLPALIIIILTIIWIQKTRSNINNKLLPRDIADQIENYSWNGFSVHKYIRYIKNGKYGIVDAVQHKIIEPAIYNSIFWRIPNKTFDAELNEEKKTITINNNTHHS